MLLYLILLLYYLTSYHIRCWTQGKPEKLVYMKKVKMWYLTDTCDALDSLTPKGHVFGSVSAKERDGHGRAVRWQHLSEMCCMTMPGAPY